MKPKILWNILENELGATKNGKAWDLPQGTRITVFLGANDRLFPVPKVVRVVSKDDYLILDSDEGRVFTDLDEVVAVRADEEANAKRDARVGFG